MRLEKEKLNIYSQSIWISLEEYLVDCHRNTLKNVLLDIAFSNGATLIDIAYDPADNVDEKRIWSNLVNSLTGCMSVIQAAMDRGLATEER